MSKWSLHNEPHRHYKVVGPKGKPTWNGAGSQRIVSVTTVLDGADALTRWAASTTLGAAETATRLFFDGVDEALDGSILSFGQLVETTGLMPDAVKDRAGAEGTAAHKYLAARLMGGAHAIAPAVGADVPYGIRVAIEDFLLQELPAVVVDDDGPRVERAVGDYDSAVAGTYDAQVYMRGTTGFSDLDVHRLDLKSSRTMQPKFFAQLAAYEWLAGVNGEDPSDYLTVVHADRAGNYKLHSIEVGSAQHQWALDLFMAYLTIYRNGPTLAKIIG